jgi:hypothetical protein
MLQDSAGQELSMPLRQKHMHQRASQQQEIDKQLQEESCSAGTQEALPVQGLTVKVKGNGWSSDSPTLPQSDRIKAFFEVRLLQVFMFIVDPAAHHIGCLCL